MAEYQNKHSLLTAVGNTPLVCLERIAPAGSAGIYAKLEFLNPSGSTKDRLVAAAIRDAEGRGVLKPGGALVEATSGNTGISLAMLGAALGYSVTIVMPADVSEDIRGRVTAFGATVVSSPPAQGMTGATAAAQRIAKEQGGLWIDQFSNVAGVKAHEDGTGAEILKAMGATRVDAFVAGVGTGATLMGVAAALRHKDLRTQIVAVEPARSPVLSGGEPGPHGIPGLGASFVPPLLRREIVTKVVPVDDDEASQTVSVLAKQEGLFVGPSSGANVAAALRVAQELGAGTCVVTVLADSGERYLRSPAPGRTLR